jgi:dihydrolipoamide dehydrogenase
MEVPSSDSGTVKEVRVKVGDKVSQGTVSSCSKRRARARPSLRRPPRRHPRPAGRFRAACGSRCPRP